MKRLAAILVLVVFLVSLSACGGQLTAAEPLDASRLQGHRIGVLLSWSPDYILEDMGGIELFRYDCLSDALLALKYGRIEALAMDFSDAVYLCSVQPAYEILNPPVALDQYVIFINNKRPDLLRQFNEFAKDFIDSTDSKELQGRLQGIAQAPFVPRTIPAHTEGPKINIAILAVAMPYTFFDLKTGESYGSDVEVARHFAWKYGYQANFIDSDWTGAIANLTTGKADIFFCALSDYYRQDVELSHTALVSAPYFPTSIHLVVVGDRTKISLDNPDLGY